jgi:chromatin modification-related protein VID21
MPTPQEFSKKRYERDLQYAEMARKHRANMIEAQQRQQQMARAAQSGAVPGTAGQQRPTTAGQTQPQAQGPQAAAVNGHPSQQARQAVPQPTRNGHLAIPQVNGQGIPQAHMRATQPVAQQADMQRMAQVNAQGRQGQYAGQQYPIPNTNSMMSPGGGMTTQQQIQNNQALLAAFQAQNQNQPAQQSHAQHPSMGQAGNAQVGQMNSQQQHNSASPSMPPPPTPQGVPQQLSSGHVPAVIAIKNQLRARYPTMTEAELTNFATEQLKHQSQSSTQVRQNAMNAAAGIGGSTPNASTATMQAYSQNQQSYQTNPHMPNGNHVTTNGDSVAQAQLQQSNASVSAQGQANYAQMMRQRAAAQMRLQQSPNTPHAQPHSSPVVAHASPNMNPVSPAVQYQGVNNMPSVPMNAGMSSQGRPPSRSNTPQMQRLGSSGGVPGINPLQSPGATPGGLQGSPRNMQASMAR